MTNEQAERMKAKLNISSGNDEKYQTTHPFVESYQILERIMKLLSDVDNEAFTQLDKGAFKDIFTDETKVFAQAINFAENPLPSLDARLKAHGIRRVITKDINVSLDGGKVITRSQKGYEEIHHTVSPLRNYAKEWMRKRHPVNRMRVKEFISLAEGLRNGEFLSRQNSSQIQDSSPTKRPY